jgi:hypothetical protein
MLTAEYSSLQSTRSLVYNEAFTRGAMFLSFVSMSLVGLALIAQTLAPGSSPLVVAIVVLALDLVVGLTTYGRIIRANYEDYLAIQAMARIRYAYAEIAPVALPYLSGGVSDDMAGVMATYGSPPVRGLPALAYQLTTSSTLVALVDAVLAAVLALAVGIALGASLVTSIWVAALMGVGVLVAIAALTARFYLGVQRSIEVRFPAARSTGATPRR